MLNKGLYHLIADYRNICCAKFDITEGSSIFILSFGN
jgi:hypothetical protein